MPAIHPDSQSRARFRPLVATSLVMAAASLVAPATAEAGLEESSFFLLSPGDSGSEEPSLGCCGDFWSGAVSPGWGGFCGACELGSDGGFVDCERAEAGDNSASARNTAAARQPKLEPKRCFIAALCILL